MVEKEYIEREYMEEIITMLKSEKGDIRVMDTETLLYFIRKVPAADVAPVRHGCWVKEKSDVLIHWYCSVCEKCYFLEEPNADYCPHCGAKMDGGDLNGS